MINFLNLEYFLVAAEELNFTRAAKKLFISQQSLSNHISNLEKEFDVVLFNRTSPLTLTYAGQALKARARELLDLRDETYKEISDIKDFSTGQLAIGVSHTRGRVILPEILPTKKKGKAELQIWSGWRWCAVPLPVIRIFSCLLQRWIQMDTPILIGHWKP